MGADDEDAGRGEPFGRWLRTRIALIALVAAVALLAWALLRPCETEAGCTPRDDLFILLPVLPLVLIGGVTLMGEWQLRRREREDADESSG